MRERISKNQRGSSLPVAILVCMLLAIGLMALQTSVMSFAQRTSVMHYDKQAYLSARNVATELAKMLKKETEAYILTYGIDERNQFENFPEDLKDLPEVALERPEGMVSWIHGLMDMNDGEIKEFENFTWNRENVPADFDPGSIKATIKRNDSTEFEIAATCMVEGSEETVKVKLSCAEFEKEGATPTPPKPPLKNGNANVFYSDYGFGLGAEENMENFDVDMPFVSGIPIYFADNLGTYQDKIQSYGNIYIDNFSDQKTGGAIVSRKNIYIQEQKTTDAYFHAGENITIGSNTWIDMGHTQSENNNMFAKLVYITGDNIRVGNGTIFAETVIIDATNFTLDSTIVANEVQFVKGTTSTRGNSAMDIRTKTGKAYWVSKPYVDGIDQDLLDKIDDESENVSHLIQEMKGTESIVIDEIVYNEWERGTRSYTVSVKDNGLDQMNLPATQIAARYKPNWADVSGMEAIPLEKVDNKEGLIVGEGDHYYYVEQGSTYDGNVFSFAQGMFQRDLNDNMGENTGQYPLVFVVEDGATLYLTGFRHLVKDGTYIILEGNAKLEIDGEVWVNMRVYADAPDSTTHQNIVAATDGIIKSIYEEYDYEDKGGLAPEGMGAKIQDAIKAEMINNWSDELAMVILDEGSLFWGNCVVPYFYSLGDDLRMRGGRYPKGYVTGDDSLSEGGELPEIEVEATDPIKMLYVNMHTYSE